MERRLAAILAADVAGYTRMMEIDEAETLGRLTSLQKTVLRPLIARHSGRIVKLTGDGLLVEFASVTESISCAIAWQSEVAGHEDANGSGREIRYRIGINVGDVIAQENDIFGSGVNIAARLEGIAQPGGICVSEDAFRQAGGKLKASFTDMGLQDLKNVGEPLRVYRFSGSNVADPVVPDTAGALEEPEQKPSIVVLPFDNLSGDPEQAFFSDGIADDIITDLSRYGELFVIARHTAFAFHDRKESAQEFARQLGVGYVLEGSVRRSGGRARVSVQLVDIASSKMLWAERYDRQVEHIFDVQEEIATVIVNTLVGQVSLRHYARVRSRGPDAISAYDHALKAQQLIWAFSPQDTARARKEAESAIRLDPGFARAHAILAWAHHIEGSNGWSEDPAHPFDKALWHAKAAIAADENEPWGHSTFGFTLFWRDRDFRRGLDETRLAVRLNPSNAHFRMIVGALLAYMGRPEEALEEIDAAMRLNPLYPALYLIHRSRALFLSCRYEEALSDMERASVAMPAHANALALLAACYAKVSRPDRAQEIVGEIRRASPDFTLEYCRRNLPYAKAADLELFCALLKESGLPE